MGPDFPEDIGAIFGDMDNGGVIGPFTLSFVLVPIGGHLASEHLVIGGREEGDKSGPTDTSGKDGIGGMTDNVMDFEGTKLPALDLPKKCSNLLKGLFEGFGSGCGSSGGAEQRALGSDESILEEGFGLSIAPGFEEMKEGIGPAFDGVFDPPFVREGPVGGESSDGETCDVVFLDRESDSGTAEAIEEGISYVLESFDAREAAVIDAILMLLDGLAPELETSHRREDISPPDGIVGFVDVIGPLREPFHHHGFAPGDGLIPALTDDIAIWGTFEQGFGILREFHEIGEETSPVLWEINGLGHSANIQPWEWGNNVTVEGIHDTMAKDWRREATCKG